MNRNAQLKISLRKLADTLRTKIAPRSRPADQIHNEDDAYPGSTEWAQWVETRITRLETRQKIYLGLLALAVLDRARDWLQVLTK